MIVAIIPAKSHSRRLKNKNLLKLNGVSLLDHTINYVKKSKYVDFFFISTESKKIQNYLKKKKIKFIKRPSILCGETPLIDVYNQVYNKIKKKYKIKIIAGVQCDHPDRQHSLDNVIKIFKKRKVDLLYSMDKKRKKNGAHYIFKTKVLSEKNNIKKTYIFDECTNIHYMSDLLKAERKLKKYEN